MVSSVQLGNFFTSGNQNLVGGGSSGLDTASLISGLIAARSIPITQLEDKVTLNDTKSAALNEYKSLVTKLKDASDLLRNVPGFNKQASNAFSYLSASVSSNTSVAGSNYLSVTVAPGTTAQSFSVDSITSLATTAKQSSPNFSVADANTAAVFTVAGANQLQAGTVTVNGAAITLSDGDSLNTVAAKFNAESDTTGIRASVIKVADNSYRLSFSATELGTGGNFDLEDPLFVTADPDGVFSQIVFNAPQVATDAVFEIDGVPITRSTNSIDDAIDGVTLNLTQATPALTTLSVNVTPDTTVAKNAIIGFINAYNDIRIFSAQQTQLTDAGTYAEDAVLAGNGLLRSTGSALSSEVTRIVSGIAGTDLRSLADIGITFIDLPESEDNPYVRNVLTLDDSKLDSALTSKFDQVRKVFEFSMESDNADLQVYSRTNALSISSFTLNIDPGTNTYEASYTDSGGPQTVVLAAVPFAGGGGYTLVGQPGTALEGLTLLYGSTSAAAINVNVSQGIGDRLYNYTDNILTQNTGSLAIELNSLKTSNEKFQSDITRLNDQLETYRLQLLDKFGRLEKALSQVNTLLQSLDAQAQARNSA